MAELGKQGSGGLSNREGAGKHKLSLEAASRLMWLEGRLWAGPRRSLVESWVQWVVRGEGGGGRWGGIGGGFEHPAMWPDSGKPNAVTQVGNGLQEYMQNSTVLRTRPATK